MHPKHSDYDMTVFILFCVDSGSMETKWKRRVAQERSHGVTMDGGLLNKDLPYMGGGGFCNGFCPHDTR